ncbi:hypothetical protein DPMN_096297 [Dreissena polymorpha]|uniref:Uncharacterized protein n=1 Tax=Dreissena polymorpha TaxID=45954 RepID=A0A9D4L961_DREPO|nr:hypothetical protein DPMN_096297 [Dreissena polymorpha]
MARFLKNGKDNWKLMSYRPISVWYTASTRPRSALSKNCVNWLLKSESKPISEENSAQDLVYAYLTLDIFLDLQKAFDKV